MPHRLLSVALFSAILLGAILVRAPQLAAQSNGGDGRPDQAVLQPAPGGQGLAAANGEYLSPATEAARPFTHMLLRRQAHVPDGAALTLYVRASADGTDWGAWTEMSENEDLWTDAIRRLRRETGRIC